MKKVGAIILIIMSIALCGCTPKAYSACLNQPMEEVSRIELHNTQNGEDVILYTIKESEVDNFWSELADLEFHRYHNDPATEYGALAVKIYYANGYVDIIGTEINGYYSPTGESMPVGWYYLSNQNDFVTLFGRYVNISQLPSTE